MSRPLHALALGAFLTLSAPAFSAETVTYGYDALGRLVSTTHSGGDNDGMQATLGYDAADNRTLYQVTGSKDHGLNNEARVLVVPLNGLTVLVF